VYADRCHGLRQLGHQPWRAGCSGRGQQQLELVVDLAPRANGSDALQNIVDGGLAHGIHGGADVERQGAGAGDHVDRTVGHVQLAHGTHQRLAQVTALLHQQDDFRRRAGASLRMVMASCPRGWPRRPG
jgi:hypothetical protein